MTAFDEITKLLPKLTGSELAKIRSRIDALSQFAGGAPATSNRKEASDEGWVLQTICDTLRSIGAESTSPARLKGTDDIAGFREKLPALMDFFDKVDQKRIIRQSLLVVGLRMLHDDLRKMRVPISGRIVMRHIHRLPAVYDQNFPGYAKAGLLGWIIKSKLVEKKEAKNVRTK